MKQQNNRMKIILLVCILVLILIGSSFFLLSINHSSSAALSLPFLQTSSTSPISSTSSKSPARLTTQGSEILTPAGTSIILRGYNWGSWGTAQEQDASDNAAQGATVVRIPLRWWGIYAISSVDSRDDTAPGNIQPQNLAQLDEYVSWASSRHLWIDLFIDSDCGQNGTQSKAEEAYCDPSHLYGSRGDNFWTDASARQRFIKVWEFIANRYKNTPYIGMYELLPEPNPTGVSQASVTEFYEELIDAVHSVDPRTPFLIGANNGYDVKQASAAYISTSTPIIYTGDLFVHIGQTQSENIADLKTRLQGLLQLRSTYSVPIFVQQAGVRSSDDPAQVYESALLALLNSNHVGWAWWTYRQDGDDSNGYGVLYEDAKNPAQWDEKTNVYNMLGGFLHDDL
jgi:hypothetical protein